jgi:hypothetical protein
VVGRDGLNQLQALSQTTGQVVRKVVPAPGHSFAHVDAEARVALAMEPHRVVEGNRIVSSTSTLVCYSLG